MAVGVLRARRRIVLGFLLAGALGVAARGASAEDPAWAREVPEKVAAQESEIARSGVKPVLARLESRVARGDADAVTLYLLARAYGKAEQWADAIATYGDVLKAEPRFWFAWRDRGVVRGKQKDLAGEEKDLRQAIAVKPDYVDALHPLGALLLETKRFDEAVTVLQRVVDADPARESARLHMVQALTGAKRFDDALKALDVLFARAPNDPLLRHQKAVILAEKGDAGGALAILKQLSVENPAAEPPLRFWRMLAVAIRKAGGQAPVDDWIWVDERLRRLVKTEDERKELAAEVEELRTAPAPSPTGRHLPSPAELAAFLRSPDAKQRAEVLDLLRQPPKDVPAPRVEGELLKALIERLDERFEPDATNRAGALIVFGGMKSRDPTPAQAFGALVRASLRDRDPKVRLKAADVLGEFKGMAGEKAGILALLPFASRWEKLDRKPTADEPPKSIDDLASAARGAIYRLAGAIPPSAEQTPEAQANAFLEWWASPERESLKLEALGDALAAADPTPEDVVFWRAYNEESPAVWTKAYKGLALVKTQSTGPTPREAWIRSLPEFPDADLVPSRRAEVRKALESWWRGKPKPRT
jgi:tetratricopeptide (TPR) repeat protein